MVIISETVIAVPGYAHLFGQDENSWAWDIPSQSLLHKGQEVGRFPDRPDAGEGTPIPKRLLMLLDRKKKTLALDVGQGPVVVFTGNGLDTEVPWLSPPPSPLSQYIVLTKLVFHSEQY